MKTLSPNQLLSSQKPRKKLSKPEHNLARLATCTPWKIGLKEAPPANHQQHALAKEEEDIQTLPPVRFHGQPPGSGRRSGGGGHRESQKVFHFSCNFSATSGHPIAPSTIFGPPELIYVVPFCRFLTVWKL